MALTPRTTLLSIAAATLTAHLACGGSPGGTGAATTTHATGGSTTTTTTSASATTSSTTTTTGPVNACTDTADITAIGATHACTFYDDVATCTAENVDGGASAIAGCLQATDGLSATCAGCYGRYGECLTTMCQAPCSGDAGTSAIPCQSCIADDCTPSLSACSGVTNLSSHTDAGGCTG